MINYNLKAEFTVLAETEEKAFEILTNYIENNYVINENLKSIFYVESYEEVENDFR